MCNIIGGGGHFMSGAIGEPTPSTEPRCDHPHCSLLEKLNPQTKSDLGKTESRIQVIYFLVIVKFLPGGWSFYTSVSGVA